MRAGVLATAALALGLMLAAPGAAFALSPPMGHGMSQERLKRAAAALDRGVADGEVAGVTALVWRHGQEAWFGASGYQDQARKTPMRRDTIFALASMTKPITGVAAMILVEEGRLRLDDPVDRFLPELANRKVLNSPTGPLDAVHDAARPITLRDLMTYRMGTGAARDAGLPADAPIVQALEALQATPGLTADEYMKRLGALPLVHEPGERFMYNTSSQVMGILIARASGMPLDQFLATRIFRPLNMVDTAFWVPEAKWERLASHYRAGPRPGTLEPAPGGLDRWRKPPAFPSGSGGLVSTVDDYMKFARMMLGNGQVDGVRILSRKSIELMTRDHMGARKDFFGRANFWDNAGFGFTVEVQTRQPGLGRSPGAYWWNGATGVSWAADPKEDMVFLLMLQKAGVSHAFRGDVEAALYQAIAD